MAEITFLNGQVLWGLFAIPLMVALHFFLMKYTRKRAVLFANFEALRRVTGRAVLSKNITLLIARILIIALLTLSAAGMTLWTKGPGSQYNYVIAIDTSSSMLADDFTPNRLASAKETAQSFINLLNPDTKIGLITFSGVTRVETQLTNDKKAVNTILDNVDISSAGGTDITGAMMTSINLLVPESDKSMAVILLTDGQQTVGSPIEEGIKYAMEKKVVLHTIGMATEKGGSFELTKLLSTIDDSTLKNIADNTGGKYFRVQDKEAMAGAFKEIILSSEQNTPHQLRIYLLIAGLILLFLEWVLISTRFRTLP